MIRRILKLLALSLLCISPAHAQLSGTLQIAKKQHLTGESVLATVTITNLSGRDLILHSDGRFQWLSFNVKSSNGTPVNARSNSLFGSLKIAAGQTMAREVDLAQHFQLNQTGNYMVSAIVRSPDEQTEGTSTNRVPFTLSPGRPYWTQKVGTTGVTNKIREFRLLNFSGDSKSLLYAQIMDTSTGQLVRTFPLGEVLMFRKPVVTVDRQQRMNVLFLATPSMWVHYVVDTDGKVINRQIHQRGPVGDPQLITMEDGSVQVSNSIPYDPKAAEEQKAKIHKASDRPVLN